MDSDGPDFSYDSDDSDDDRAVLSSNDEEVEGVKLSAKRPAEERAGPAAANRSQQNSGDSMDSDGSDFSYDSDDSDDSVLPMIPTYPTIDNFMAAQQEMKTIVELIENDPVIGNYFWERRMAVDEFRHHKKILLLYIFQNGVPEQSDNLAVNSLMDLLMLNIDSCRGPISDGEFFYTRGDEDRIYFADAGIAFDEEFQSDPNVSVIRCPPGGFGDDPRFRRPQPQRQAVQNILRRQDGRQFGPGRVLHDG